MAGNSKEIGWGLSEPRLNVEQSLLVVVLQTDLVWSLIIKRSSSVRIEQVRESSGLPVLLSETVDWRLTFAWSYSDLGTVVKQTHSLIIWKLKLSDNVVLSVVLLLLSFLLLFQLVKFPLGFGLLCLLFSLIIRSVLIRFTDKLVSSPVSLFDLFLEFLY